MSPDLRAEALKLRKLFDGASPLSYGLGTDLRNPDGSLRRSEKNKVLSEVTHHKGQPTLEMFADHLAGIRRLGLVPATPWGHSLFGGIDIDRYDKPPNGYSCWADFYLERCRDLRLSLIVTKTRSGGVRLIAFFESPVPSDLLRCWLYHVATSMLGLPADTEIFPKQDRVDDDNLGNFFFLPWFGEGKVSDQIIYCQLPEPLSGAFSTREEADRAYGLKIRKDWEPEQELSKAGLKFTPHDDGRGRVYLNYYVEMGKCLVKNGEHEGNRGNRRCSAFVFLRETRLLYHSCFSCQDRIDKPKTRSALEALGIRIEEVIDVKADFSDQALIARWAKLAVDSVVYVVDDRSWSGYNKGIWKESVCGPLYEIGEFLKANSPGLPTNGNKALTQLHKHLLSQRLASSLLILAKGRPELRASLKDFDPDPWLLGLPAGLVLDLRTGRTRQATPADRITKTIAVQPGGPCPRWLAYLEQAQPDPEVRAYLQRLMGYCLTAETREQCLVFFIGIAGSGKNTFLHPFEKLLGPYYASLGLSALLESTDEYQRMTMLAGLVGVRLASIQEAPQKKGFDANTIKALTGSGTVTARRMRHEPFTFSPTFKPLILANAPPKMNQVDEALKQRVHVVSFQQRFRGTEREDKQLMQKLDAELSGILSWAIEGCLAWQESGLKPPLAVLEATQDYISEADTFEVWLQEHTEEDPGAFTPSTALFDQWKRYCFDIGEAPGGINEIRAKLLEKRPKLRAHLAQDKELIKKYGRVRGFIGIRLSPRQQEFPPSEF